MIKPNIKTTLPSLIMLSILTITSGCSKNSSSNYNHDMLRVDMGAEVPTLDPQLIEDKNSQRVANDLFMGVVTSDQNNMPIPGLAKSWDISKDDKTYTFHLRDDIKFSDGTPISAKDVVYSWQRLVDPKTGSPYTYIATSIKNAQQITNNELPATSLGVDAIDDKTVRLTLIYPDKDILAKLTLSPFSVISRKAVQKHNKKWTKAENLVTSGAYKLKEHVINGYLLEEKNPFYYNAKNVSINQVKFFPLVDSNGSLSKYKSGDLEITWTVPVDQFKEIRKEYKNQLHVTPLEGLVYYDLNMLHPEFKNPKTREALSLAIDRVALAKEVLGTGVIPSYSIVTHSIDGGKYSKVTYPWVNDPRTKQIALAKQLYKEAGYSANNPLKLVITYSTDDEKKKVALAIASMWKAVLGANVTIQNQDWKTFLQALQKGDYQIAADRWFADYNGVTTYTQMYVCHALENSSKYCNPEYDKYIKEAMNATTTQQSVNAYNKALQIALNDYATIPLYQLVSTRLIKPYVKGYTPDTNHLDDVSSEWIHY
ncbi:MAG: ABC transporter substrate-binding protein [Neisseriaceae bacterium]